MRSISELCTTANIHPKFTSHSLARQAPHRDGPFVRTDEERSVYTVMAYLNDAAEYVGGETVFYSGNKSGDLSAEAGQVVATTRGARGTGLVFQHEMFHEVRSLTDTWAFARAEH